MKTIPLPCLLAATALGLSACGSTTPLLDTHFGQAVTTARAQQLVDPAASMAEKPADGLDGRATRNAMVRYQESFRAPPSSFDAANIGGSVGGGGQ